MLGVRKKASEMLFSYPKMRYDWTLKILFMEFLKYSPFNQHQLLIISFLMARETALTIFKKLINQITFIWGFGTFLKKMMAESYVLGIYFKQHDEAELEKLDSVGSGNPSSFPSLPLCSNLSSNGLNARNRLFIGRFNAEHHPEQSCPYWIFLRVGISLSVSFPQGFPVGVQGL